MARIGTNGFYTHGRETTENMMSQLFPPKTEWGGVMGILQDTILDLSDYYFILGAYCEIGGKDEVTVRSIKLHLSVDSENTGMILGRLLQRIVKGKPCIFLADFTPVSAFTPALRRYFTPGKIVAEYTFSYSDGFAAEMQRAKEVDAMNTDL